jgi:cytochrome b6-f complex subunit 5
MSGRRDPGETVWAAQRGGGRSCHGWRKGTQCRPAHGRIVPCFPSRRFPMIEPLLCGIVLGLIPVTLVGLFVAAWNQYRRGSALGG